MKRQAERMTKFTASESHDEVIHRRLCESQRFVIQYLKTALANDDYPGAFLVALRSVVVARGVLTKVAKAAGIERESLYRALSAKGNPRMSTLVAVTKAMGLRLTVESVR
jgi:probable addiction module antidote protein